MKESQSCLLGKSTIRFCLTLMRLTLFLSDRIGVEKKGSLVNEQVFINNKTNQIHCILSRSLPPKKENALDSNIPMEQHWGTYPPLCQGGQKIAVATMA